MAKKDDDKTKLYIALGATAVAIGAGALIYYFYNKKKHGDSGEDERRTHSSHHERQAKAKSGKHDEKGIRNALDSIDFARASKLSKEQIGAIWERYDTDHSGYLDENELKKLVRDVLGQIAEEKAVLTKYMTSMFDESTDAGSQAEIRQRLKEVHVRLHGEANGVAKQLMRRLDVNRDKKVSKEEFVQAFAGWLEKHHEQAIRDYLTPEGPAPPHVAAHKEGHNVSVVQNVGN